jgi:formate C-acetyltransferase
VTESIGGMGDDGRPLVTRNSFRFLQTLYNLGPAPEPNLTIWYSPRLPVDSALRRQGGIDTSSSVRKHEIMRRAERRRRPPVRVADGGRQQMQFFGARASLSKCLLCAISGGRDELAATR